MQLELPVELRGTLTISDVRRYSFFHVSRPKWVLWLWALVLSLLGLTSISVRGSGWSFFLSQAVPFVLIGLLWALIMVVVLHTGARRQFMAQSAFREPVIYVFASEAFGGNRPSASWTAAWSTVNAVRETKSLFLLYQAPRTAIIVPKRFFQSPEQMEQWRQLVLASVAPKKIEKPGLIGRWC